MHPYIPHLLADIAAAHRTETQGRQRQQSIEEHFEEVERWIAGEEPPHTFGYFCGLNVEQFPPAAQLTNRELKLICKAFHQMMFTWNLDADFPKTLPPARYYELLINTLGMKTEIVNSGSMSFDFCTGYAPDCIFKEYCPCLKIWNEAEEEDIDLPPRPPGELPF